MPEQLRVRKDLDGRADIYSLGIISRNAEWNQPFGLGQINKTLVRCQVGISSYLETTDSTSVQLGLSQLSPELEAVMRCLQKAPEQRFASVEELKRALKLLLPLLTLTRPRRLLVTLQSLAHSPRPQASRDPILSQPLTPTVLNHSLYFYRYRSSRAGILHQHRLALPS